MKTRALIGALIALAVVAGAGAWWLRGGADAQVTVDEAGDRVQTVRRGQLPVFADAAEVARLYRFATENPQAFAGVECTCGCAAIGHATNRVCYIKSETADQVTYTSHAAT